MNASFLRAPEARAARLGRAIRDDARPAMRRRRAVLALSLVSTSIMGLVTAYQTGLVRRLPEPPLPKLDTAKVNGSGEAYAYLETPDGALGLASYAATAVLAAMSAPGRARSRPWVPLALAAKAALDAAEAARLTVDQWRRHRAFCIYCLAAAGATFAALPLALPEAREALRVLRLRRAGGRG